MGVDPYSLPPVPHRPDASLGGDFFELLPMPSAVLRLDWRVEHSNEAMRNACGLAEGASFLDLIPPVDRREFVDQAIGRLAEVDLTEISTRIFAGEGRHIWKVMIRATANSRLLVVCHDVSQVTALQDRQEEQARFQDVIERSAGIGAWRVREGGGVEISAGLRKMLGREWLTPDAGKTGYERIAIEELPGMTKLVLNTLSRQAKVEQRLQIDPGDGSLRNIRFVAMPSTGLSEAPGPVQGVAIDETEIQSARMAAEANQERLEFVLRLAEATVWEYDTRTCLLKRTGAGPLTTAKTATISNLEPDPATIIEAEWFWQQMAPDDLPVMRAALRAHLIDDVPFTQEHRLRTAAGDYRWVLTIIHAYTDEAPVDGNDKAFHGRLVGFTFDIHERKMGEIRLEEAKRDALAAAEAKGRFLANMSHEIRTPLNGVIGLVGALGLTELSPTQADMVQLIRSSGESLDRILSDILEFSKIQENHLQLLLSEFNLRHALESVTHVLAVRANEKSIEFRTEYSPDAEGLFLGDNIRIKQILTNLASNAIKFTHAGSVVIRVGVQDLEGEGAPNGPASEARALPCHLCIEVEDSGIGFDAETGARLFQRFEQADSSITRQFGGSGLGLSIVKGLVEAMDGHIDCRSQLNKGSVFRVEIPLKRTISLDLWRTRSQVIEAPTPIVADVPEAGRPVRILLAEDHPTNQKVVSLILRPFNFSLTMADNGQDALSLFERSVRTEPFDLILMDMQMPIMDGLTATRKIREYERTHQVAPIPIAMLTANAMPEHRADAKAAGADHYIAKPVTPEGLISGIRTALKPASEEAA